MRTIKQLAPKLSDALQAMVDGLNKQSKRQDFAVDMSTFGMAENGICFGCAATCAVQELAQINLTEDCIENAYDRAATFNVTVYDLDTFEKAIDTFRRGNPYVLLAYYGIVETGLEWMLHSYCGLRLNTNDWKEKIPIVENYIKELKRLNL